MRRIALAALLALAPTLAAAQFAVIAPTQPQADNGDRIATTAWVNGLIANGLTLSSGKIWIGSAGNIATPQTPSGDCTIGLSGILTCTKTNGVAFATSATTDTTNATNIASGTLAAARMAAFGSGDVSFAAAGGAGTIAANAVSNAKLATMPQKTIKCNNTTGTANALDCTVAQISALLTPPTTQVFLSGSGTYTTPANVTWIEVILVGGGGGGAGSGTTPGAAGNGGDTCLRASGAACTTPLYDAGGGSLGPANGATGGGGVISGSGTCNVRALAGGNGQPASGLTVAAGSNGGNSALGGGGFGAASGGGAGAAAASGSGSGGGGGASGGTANSGGGGGAGALCDVIITAPAATYTYAVGAAGTAGTAGTGGSAGGGGGAGSVVFIEHYGG